MCTEFYLLQDAVPARPFAEIKALVERELGQPVDNVFASIEEAPLGAATIGQVHGAVLRNGDRVVVKVQYPEVEQLFMEDLQTVKTFCSLLQPEMSPMLEEVRTRALMRGSVLLTVSVRADGAPVSDRV